MENPLERIRKEYGLTKPEMAAVMETSYTGYNNYASGKAFAGKKKLKLVAEFFGVDFDLLVKEMEEYKKFITARRREEAMKKVRKKIRRAS